MDTEDTLKDFPKTMHDKYEFIDAMPVCLDLKTANAVGFIGSRTKLYQMEKNLIIGFAASHFYKDIKLFLIMDKVDVPLFSWARWLPITYNEQNKLRNLCMMAKVQKARWNFCILNFPVENQWWSDGTDAGVCCAGIPVSYASQSSSGRIHRESKRSRFSFCVF